MSLAGDGGVGNPSSTPILESRISGREVRWQFGWDPMEDLEAVIQSKQLFRSSMSADVPLINGYKRLFLLHRVLSTFMGGLTFNKEHVVLGVLDLSLFLLPLILVCILFNVVSDVYVGSLVLAISMVAVNLLLQCIVRWTRRPTANRIAPYDINVESDNNDNDSVDTSKSVFVLLSILVHKQPLLVVVFDALVLMLLSFLSYLHLHWKSLESLLIREQLTIRVLQMSGSFTVLTAIHALMVSPPVEMAVYRADTTHLSLNKASRAVHACLVFGLINVLHKNNVILDSDMRIVGYVLISLMPVLWSLGILPQLEPLLLWFMEQTQIIFFGGSYTFEPWDTFINLAISVITSVTLLTLVHSSIINGHEFRVLAGILGLLLALNVPRKLHKMIRLKRSRLKFDLRLIRIALAFLLTVVVLITVFPCSYEPNSVDESNLRENKTFVSVFKKRKNMNLVHVVCPSWLHSLLTGLSLVTFIANLMLILLTHEYILFGVIRNPLTKLTLSTSALMNTSKLITSTTSLVVLYLISMLSVLSESQSSSLIEMLCLIRVLRWAWQRPNLALQELLLLNLLQHQLQLGLLLPDLGPASQLLLIFFARDRFVNLLNLVNLVFIVNVASVWPRRVTNRPYAPILVLLNLVLMPMLAMVVLVAALVSAPILAFFTLPIFCVAYPRPNSFWPRTRGSMHSNLAEINLDVNRDSVYYDQLIQPLLAELAQRLPAAQLLPDFMLVRQAERLLVLQVVERGHDYVEVRARGLEMQEVTSCHHLETSNLDVFIENDHCCKMSICQIFEPVVGFHVLTYEDTKIQLTGVLDHKNAVSVVVELFIKTLVWFKLRHTDSEKDNDDNGHNNEQHTDQVTFLSGLNNDDSNDDGDDSSADECTAVDEVDDHVDAGHVDSAIGLKPLADVSGRRAPLPPLRRRNSADSLTEKLDAILVNSEPNDSSNKKLNNDNLNKTKKKEFKARRLPDQQRVNRLSVLQVLTPTPLWLSRVISSVAVAVRRHQRQRRQDDSHDDDHDDLRDTLATLETLVTSSLLQVFGSMPNVWYNFELAFHDAFFLAKVFNNGPKKGLDKEIDTELLTSAFRAAVKLAIDRLLEVNRMDSMEDFLEAMEEVSTEWYLGNQDDEQWRRSVRESSKQNLFTIFEQMDESGCRVVRSRLLSLSRCPLRVCSLQRELVRCLWSSLNMELVYMTNDDDERFSIQADTRLMRNLVVQAADPPLGYPVFSPSNTFTLEL